MKKNKSTIPEDILDYCIDNELTLKEGLSTMIEKKFESMDRSIKDLKRGVTDTMDSIEDELDRVTDSDIDDVENFLKFLDDSNPNL